MTATGTAKTIDQQHQEDLERLSNLRLLDDDFFSRCLDGDTDNVALILRIMLEKPDLRVEDARTQVFVANILKRSIKLDVVATDAAGREYDIEIQRADKGAGAKRARYHSCMLDTNYLKKGVDFEKLPETYIIFITENDIIGRGKPLYPVERCFMDTGEAFGDEAHILYVNGAYRGADPLGKLMHDFACTDPNEMNYKQLADRVRFFKNTEEGVATMCRAMEEMREQAAKEARKASMIEIALRMLEKGKLLLTEIAEYSGLTLEEVQELQEKLATA